MTRETYSKKINRKLDSKHPKLALVQHPMWFLVGEDRITASRTPPWGARDLDEYSQRVHRNLNSLQKNHRLKINFDFSSVELEDLFEKYPDLGERIKKYVKKGQLGFVNGTYSQPHMHTLSLEANIRQLDIGIQVIQELTGYRVRTHAMQEPDYSDQTVQLLNAFGFQFASRGEFITGLVTCPHKTEETPLFYRWKGLDGSRIALVTTYPVYAVDPIRHDEMTIPTAKGPVAIKYPDMEEFHPDPGMDYVLLDEFMEKQIKNNPPNTDARIYIPWGYVEGTQAEELMRENVKTEIALLQAETLEALSPMWSKDNKQNMLPLWKLWLKTQHHDAYWADGPELRRKSIKWCQQAKKMADRIIHHRIRELILNTSKNGTHQGILLFSIYPKESTKPVFQLWKGTVPTYLEAPNKVRYPVQISRNLGSGEKEVFFIPKTSGVESVPLSFSSKSITKSTTQKNLKDGWKFHNQFYTANLTGDGSFRQIELNDGLQFIQIPVGLGGQLSALIKHENIIDKFENQISSSTVESGQLADIIDVKGKIGPVKVNRRIYFYHELPWFESTIECDFPDIELGDFAEDGYKLCFWWPAWLRNSITHGIPGGAITADSPEICFYPVNWMDIKSFRVNYAAGSRQDGGLAIANWGTLKGFRRQGRIGLVLAWGTKERDFGNRTNAYPWAKKMDLKLKGKHLFRLAFYPHNGDWKSCNIPDWSNDLLRPAIINPTVLPEKIGPLDIRYLSMKSPSLVPTAILPGKNGVRVRFYESKGVEPNAQFYWDRMIIPVKYFDVAGQPLRKLRPWIIGEAFLPIKK